MGRAFAGSRCVLSPGLAQAPVLDVLCTHFVLTLTLRQAGRFNLRRDWNSLLSLVGRHLVWPLPVLGRVRGYLQQRCKGNPQWKGHEQLGDDAFVQRHGPWRGPYEDGTLFFYIDEYTKDAPKDLLTVLTATCDWLARQLKTESTLVQKNIDALAGLLQLNPAERALLLYGTLARYQRDLRGLLLEFKVSNAQEAYAALAAVAGVEAGEVADALRAGSRLERIGMIENLLSEQNITDLADLMKVSEQLPPVLMRKYRMPGELMAVFTRPATQSELTMADFAFVADDAAVLTALLSNATQRKEPGVNVLLYGPPDTGKTELAKVRRPRRQAGGHGLRPVAAERGMPLRGAEDRGRAGPPRRPGTRQHAMLPRPARHWQDGAGRAHRPRLAQAADDAPGRRPGQQVRRRNRAEMARMFDEAGTEGAVLLLDEADSFLRSRRLAERNHEITEVNEMLQRMERFAGIFICTTNLFDELDAAALRRFTFKIRFQPLSAAQRVRMFVAEALAGDASALTNEQRARRLALDQLVPGDFAAVQRQIDTLGSACDADEFLAQLESEHRVKPEVRQRRGIGFQH